MLTENVAVYPSPASPGVPLRFWSSGWPKVSSTLSRCDRILVLADGRIVEEGTHDDLLSLRGAYFDLYSRQMLARELEESS